MNENEQLRQLTLLQVLASRVASDPDGPYLDFEGTEVTARQIDEDSGRLAHALADLGVKKGDRVATLLENRVEQVESFFGVLKLGAIHQPVNTAYRGDYLQHQLVDGGVKVLIIQGDFASRFQQLDVMAMPEFESVIVVGTPDEPITAKPAYDWEELLTGRPCNGLPDPKITPSDLACFIYTSGTTGPSKGCMLPHNYLVTLSDQLARMSRRRPDDVVLTPLPLFHLAALTICVVGTLIAGGRASIGRRFSVSGFWPEVKRTRATIISVLGSLATLIANSKDHPDQVGHTLRVCISVPMPPGTEKVWRERFGCATWAGGYGLSEASLIATLPADEIGKPGSPGRPNSHEFEVQIVDENDFEVPAGTVGEIVVRPKIPNVMFTGYFRRPQDTLAVMRNMWLHTGDLGRIDEDGFLFFVDRKKDYMRRRGENISSFELEKTFLNHEAIKDVAVHSVPSEMGEDDVKVTATLRDGVTLGEEELCAWAVKRLPYFAVPRYIEFRKGDLPRTPSGKVLKFQLREEGKTPTTWDREAAGFTFERS